MQTRSGGQGTVVRLDSIPADAAPRFKTGLAEFDYVLGGGIVPGSLVLVGGEPGIGKSTLLLQCAARLEASGVRTLYASGEESPEQVRLRAERRLAEAARHGFGRAFVGSRTGLRAGAPPGLELVRLEHLGELADRLAA